jgi:hypothetical protein
MQQAAETASGIAIFIAIVVIGVAIFLIVKFLLLCRDVGDIVSLLESIKSSSKGKSILTPENRDKQTCKYCGEKYEVGQSTCPYCGKKP